jgi:ubiquinone/menaquinone biosynthesis C-methylase UbiE
MGITNETNSEQTALWNGPAGRAWVDAQELLDAILKPFEDLLVDAVAARSGSHALDVLDVGCGTGSTTLAIARLLGEKSHCLGIDISKPMIAAAQARAERTGSPARFVSDNAQVHVFGPASFDMVVSRFGVMFFDDPIQAFANLRRAARDDAALRFVVWRSPAENPFMTTAERAAAPLLPNFPERRPDAPGQFAFANGNRVRAILEESGWAQIELESIAVDCTLPEKALLGYVTRLGPVGLALQEADEVTRAHVAEVVRTAFDPFVYGDVVRFSAACWMVSARAN